MAGEIMVERFDFGMKRETKEDGTVVTDADLAINQLVLNLFERDFPRIRVISEEGGREVPEAEYAALCDPLDGTLPFSRGLPISAFCLSILDDGQPIIAVINDPFMKRLWYAELGKGSFLNGKKLEVSRHHDIDRSHLGVLFWPDSPFHLLEVAGVLVNRGARVINPWTIAYLGGLVASGDLDATIFPGRNGWETAAMQLIVTEAGGFATDIEGQTIDYRPDGKIKGHVISNGLIHQRLVDIISRCL
ncbi:MAG: inositol monophosphatase [Candidatus Vogelbacteria bacterium]|nr:inositol monophosphatase [Candidatus Vogelbacteria bacterium]